MSLERSIGNRVDCDLGDLPDLHVRNVRLVDFDLRLNDGHVGERQQHRARIVHGADDGGLALLNIAARDDAVDRRLDAHLAEVVARALEHGTLLCDAALLRLDLFLALLHVRLRGPHVVHHLVERLARRELLAPEVLLARQVLLGLLQLHFRRLDRLPHLIERLFRRLQRGGVAVDARAQRLRIDLKQELPDLDAIPFVHGEVDDAARRVGRDLHETLGLDFARGRHDGFEVARPDGLGRHRKALVFLEIEICADDCPANEDNRDADEDLLLARHLRS